ncbi:BON1-associated protein 2 [Solanum lycopersicum]|uniref:C2 domain-containing protein n=1 Tax=Solanum lycopersicum TaxID=4081 RepID=A0A3Q7ELC9_SOLLC|nr:BON1-associated protein 2 [Solanum lycopersicum]
MEEGTQILEINLISAQSLKTPVANLRRMQTYAILWVDSSTKLRTKIDHLGGENPTWNDKFLFRVSPEFISGETSGVSVEIYAVGYIKDFLIGTVRLLISSCLKGIAKHGITTATPAFNAVQVRRPSGRFHGVLNIAAAVYSSSDFSLLDGLSAICFGDLMEEKENGSRWRRRRLSRGGSKRSEPPPSSGGESYDFSDGTDSTTSSSSSSAVSMALKDCNCVPTVTEMAGKKDLKSDGGGLLCGLMLQKKIPFCPFDQNSSFWTDSFEKEP